jgi:cell division protein FtsX
VEVRLGLFVTQIPIVATLLPPQDNAKLNVLRTFKVIVFVDKQMRWLAHLHKLATLFQLIPETVSINVSMIMTIIVLAA